MLGQKMGYEISASRMQYNAINRKRTNKMEVSYTLEDTVLENVDSIKYLGGTIRYDLRWNTHIRNMCTKANRYLGFLRRNLYQCPQDVKEAAYRGLVRPILEYDSCVWDPQGVVLQQEIEKVQNRAAKFVTSNYTFETGSMTGILENLKWESLKKRRRKSRLTLLYKGLKGASCIPIDDFISPPPTPTPPIRRSRNHHSLTFQTPATRTDIYKGSFFPQTFRDWNALPDSIITSAEGAEGGVPRFTSLVRARD